MTTYDERWMWAHKRAVALANRAHLLAAPGKKYDAYRTTYEREMEAFEHLETMRKPLPDQARIDEISAALLGGDEL